jgi:hypothetical protein
MEKLKRRYSILSKQIADCWLVIGMIQAMKENLVGQGRVYTNTSNVDAKNYLYCLEENLTIERYKIEKQIVAKILNLIENGLSPYTEFVPYKLPTGTTNLIHKTKFILCEYDGFYYLLSGSIEPNEETYLTSIHNNLKEAVDGFYNKCQGYINIRKTIDFRNDITPEQQAKLDKVEYNEIPKYDEILKQFTKSSSTETYVDEFDSQNKS